MFFGILSVRFLNELFRVLDRFLKVLDLAYILSKFFIDVSELQCDSIVV